MLYCRRGRCRYSDKSGEVNRVAFGRVCTCCNQRKSMLLLSSNGRLYYVRILEHIYRMTKYIEVGSNGRAMRAAMCVRAIDFAFSATAAAASLAAETPFDFIQSVFEQTINYYYELTYTYFIITHHLMYLCVCVSVLID